MMRPLPTSVAAEIAGWTLPGSWDTVGAALGGEG